MYLLRTINLQKVHFSSLGIWAITVLHLTYCKTVINSAMCYYYFCFKMSFVLSDWKNKTPLTLTHKATGEKTCWWLVCIISGLMMYFLLVGTCTQLFSCSELLHQAWLIGGWEKKHSWRHSLPWVTIKSILKSLQSCNRDKVRGNWLWLALKNTEGRGFVLRGWAEKHVFRKKRAVSSRCHPRICSRQGGQCARLRCSVLVPAVARGKEWPDAEMQLGNIPSLAALHLPKPRAVDQPDCLRKRGVWGSRAAFSAQGRRHQNCGRYKDLAYAVLEE